MYRPSSNIIIKPKTFLPFLNLVIKFSNIAIIKTKKGIFRHLNRSNLFLILLYNYVYTIKYVQFNDFKYFD